MRTYAADRRNHYDPWRGCPAASEGNQKQIGYVPDFFGVYDNLKVSEYMDFYGSMYRMTSREIAAVSNDLLELVNLSDKKRFMWIRFPAE